MITGMVVCAYMC